MNSNTFKTLTGNKVSAIYFAEDFVDSWYDDETGIMVITWFDLSLSLHYRRSYLQQIKVAGMVKPKAVIIDTSRAFGVASPQDQKWFLDNIMPLIKTLELRNIINIFPMNSIAKVGVKNMITIAQNNNLPILQLSSLEEAVNYIRRKTEKAELNTV